MPHLASQNEYFQYYKPALSPSVDNSSHYLIKYPQRFSSYENEYDEIPDYDGKETDHHYHTLTSTFKSTPEKSANHRMRSHSLSYLKLSSISSKINSIKTKLGLSSGGNTKTHQLETSISSSKSSDSFSRLEIGGKQRSSDGTVISNYNSIITSSAAGTDNYINNGQLHQQQNSTILSICSLGSTPQSSSDSGLCTLDSSDCSNLSSTSSSASECFLANTTVSSAPFPRVKTCMIAQIKRIKPARLSTYGNVFINKKSYTNGYESDYENLVNNTSNLSCPAKKEYTVSEVLQNLKSLESNLNESIINLEGECEDELCDQEVDFYLNGKYKTPERQHQQLHKFSSSIYNKNSLLFWREQLV